MPVPIVLRTSKSSIRVSLVPSGFTVAVSPKEVLALLLLLAWLLLLLPLASTLLWLEEDEEEEE